MARDEQENLKTRKYFRPPGLKRLLTMGISTPSTDGTNHGLSVTEEWRALQDGLQAHQMLCPNCGTQLKLTDVFDDDGDPEPGIRLIGGPDRQNKLTRSLGCECGYTLPVEEVLRDARAEVNSVKSAETQYYIYGSLTVAIFAGISYLNGSGATLLGGMILGLFLIIRGVLFRFRSWQLADPDNRMFQDRTQFWAWIKYEFSN